MKPLVILNARKKKRLQLHICQHQGELRDAKCPSKPAENLNWDTVCSYVFDTEETAFRSIPYLPPNRRLIIEAELDNQIPGLSVVATVELERLHTLPAGCHPSSSQWCEWYGADGLMELAKVFTVHAIPIAWNTTYEEFKKNSPKRCRNGPSVYGAVCHLSNQAQAAERRQNKVDEGSYPDGHYLRIMRGWKNEVSSKNIIEGFHISSCDPKDDSYTYLFKPARCRQQFDLRKGSGKRAIPLDPIGDF